MTELWDTTYTVRIETCNDQTMTWRQVGLVRMVTNWTGTAQELADWSAETQTEAHGPLWRVLVFYGPDGAGYDNIEWLAEHYHDPFDLCGR